MKTRIFALILCLGLAPAAFAEHTAGIDVYTVFDVAQMTTNGQVAQSLSKLTGETNGFVYSGTLIGHINVAPAFSFEKNFQSDALIDVYLMRPFGTNSLALMIRQTYLDFLFWDTLSVRTGLLKLDYGFNSYYHPLNIDEIFPGLKSLYREIDVGTEQQGFEGVPAIKLNVSLKDLFGSALNVSFDQSFVASDVTDLKKSFYVSYLSFVCNGLNAGMLAGYSEGLHPVFGANLSALLPLKILFFMEGIYRTESFRTWIDEDSAAGSYRTNAAFVNASASLQWSGIVFKNNLSAVVEYFYYGEGMNQEMYERTADFLADSDANLIYYTGLFGENRSFMNNLCLQLSYTLPNSHWGFGYKLLSALDTGVFRHELSVSKAFDSATVKLGGVFDHSTDENDYETVYQAVRWYGYAVLSTSF